MLLKVTVGRKEEYNSGVLSVVACTLVCETGSTRSILVGHPNAALADLVIATV
jgi:hypothetical protein